MKQKIWDRYFNEMWKALLLRRKDVGCFLLFHDTREVMFDENVAALLGLERDVDYDTFSEQLRWLRGYQGNRLPLQLFEIEEEEHTAGFICANLLDSGAAEDIFLSRGELIKELAANGGKKALACFRFDREDEGKILPVERMTAVNGLSELLPKGVYLSRHTEQEYWMLLPEHVKPEVFLKELQKQIWHMPLINEFEEKIAEESHLYFTAGLCRQKMEPNRMLHAAGLALFMAQSMGIGTIQTYDEQAGLLKNEDMSKIARFIQLLDQNLFQYHFQPIISARSGDIVAYEALMRTGPEIGFNPLEILGMAERYNRLYDIEKATMENVLAHLSENQEVFEKRRIFINSISSHLLADKDFQALTSTYGELMEKVVIEMTEQTEISDFNLERLTSRMKKHRFRLAIDDYGTGYSNTSKLISLNPDYVKLDRSLISDIDHDPRKVNVVKGLVEMIHANGGQVLGEGVETRGELETLIGLGCDLFQGYYISRPRPVLLNEIAASVKAEIEQQNLQNFGEIRRVYQPLDKEVVKLADIVADHYTDIVVGEGSVEIKGEENHLYGISINVKDSVKAEITLKDVNLLPDKGRTALSLGRDTDVKVYCAGNSKFQKTGIAVPENAKFYLGGVGNLTILAENNDCYAIGANSKNACGSIHLDMHGKLVITTNGEYCVGIGAGLSTGKITITRGLLSVNCSGGTCVCIGSLYGKTSIDIKTTSISCNNAVNKCVAIGSLEGNADVSLHQMELDCQSVGSYVAGVGTIFGAKAQIRFYAVNIKSSLRGRRVISVGSSGGELDCEIDYSTIHLYHEGENVSGIGDRKGTGRVKLTDLVLVMKFFSGDAFTTGCGENPAEVVRGNQEIEYLS